MDVNLIEEAQIWKQQFGENQGDNIKVFGVYNDEDRTHTSLHSCLVGEYRVRDIGGPKDPQERNEEQRVRDMRSPKVPQERSKGERMRDMRGPQDLQGDEEWQVPMQKDENGPEFTETPFESGGGHLSAAELGEGSTVFLMSQAEENTYYLEGQLGSQKCMMLLDTGCSHSVMPYDLYTGLEAGCKLQWSPSGGHGVLADGSRIAIQGVGTVKLRLGDLDMEHSFQLTDTEGKILLGMDFFKKHRCVLDLHRCTISICSHTFD